MTTQLFWIILLSGSVLCQNEIPDELQDLGKKIASDIPGLENFNESSVPSLEDVQNLIKDKCEKNGGTGSFEKLEVKLNSMCISLK